MRIIRNPQHRDRDDQTGIIAPHPVLPTISRRHKRRILRGVVPRHRPMSLGYASWIAFLVFYLVFGRLMVTYYMVTGGLGGESRGTAIRLLEVPLTGDDVDAMLAGEDSGGRGEAYELNTLDNAIRHVRVLADGSRGGAGESDNGSTGADLCRERSERGKYPVAIITLPCDATLQDMVQAADAVQAGRSYGCTIEIRFTSPDCHRTRSTGEPGGGGPSGDVYEIAASGTGSPVDRRQGVPESGVRYTSSISRSGW